MPSAYFDCSSGISGDMTLAALLDCGASLQPIQDALDALELRASLSLMPTRKCGLASKKLHIDAPEDLTHRNLEAILNLLNHPKIPPAPRRLASRIFQRLAKAEAKVHGVSIDQVHFHEIGAIDSIIDILGTAIAWAQLDIQRASASPVPTGSGQVRIAHGLFPIPAPATAELLRSIPIAPSTLPFELTTPTGAAILAELIDDFGPLPAMNYQSIGYGAGTRDLPNQPNVLRVFLGTPSSIATSSPTQSSPQDYLTANLTSSNITTLDTILVFETNLDDIPPEQIGFAISQLWQAGALDVYCTPIQMKKNRPGTLLSVLAPPHLASRVQDCLFRHTGTLGIRISTQQRVILPRTIIQVPTAWGPVQCKLISTVDGTKSLSPEFDHCAQIAIEQGLSLPEVIRTVENAYRNPSTTKAPELP
jgi:uncharacterized protein (TIGR00299 family) protein